MTFWSRDSIFVIIGRRLRSNGHKMYTAKMHHNSLLGVTINFIVWSRHVDDPPPPTSGAQTGWHCIAGCLATGPRSLHFMAVYFKNAKVYKLQNMHVFMMGSWSHDQIMVKVGQRSRSYGHIIYACKMFHNPIMGGHINFILGGSHGEDTPTSAAQNGCHGNAGCLATKSAIYARIFQKRKRLQSSK